MRKRHIAQTVGLLATMLIMSLAPIAAEEGENPIETAQDFTMIGVGVGTFAAARVEATMDERAVHGSFPGHLQCSYQYTGEYWLWGYILGADYDWWASDNMGNSDSGTGPGNGPEPQRPVAQGKYQDRTPRVDWGDSVTYWIDAGIELSGFVGSQPAEAKAERTRVCT